MNKQTRDNLTKIKNSIKDFKQLIDEYNLENAHKLEEELKDNFILDIASNKYSLKQLQLFADKIIKEVIFNSDYVRGYA